jgi:hypothetical protein
MEIIDLLPPIERLSEVYRGFVAKLEKKLADDAKRLDETFEHHRRLLHLAHEQTVSSYQSIFNHMLEELNHQEHIPIVTFFEKAIRSKRTALYSKALEQLQENIEAVEKNGGNLEFSSRIKDYSTHHRSSYFNFYGGFWDVDDHVLFKVNKEYVSSLDIEKQNKDKHKLTKFTVIEQERNIQKDIEPLIPLATDIPQFTATE